jgi:hypothetical protein
VPFDAGAVIGRLEMNIAGWTKAVDTVKKDQASLSGLVMRHDASIKKLGQTFTVAGGIMVASLGAMIKKTADYGDELNDLSQRTGIATEILSGYKLAADKSGTSIEGFATGMKGLSRVMVEAASGGKEAKDAFKDVGVSATDSAGKVRPLDQVMLDVADRFAAMPDGAEKNALAMKLFGKAGMDLIPMLNMGRKGLEENAAAAKRYGMVISQEAAKKCDEFNDSLAELQGSMGGIGREIAMALLPTVKSLIEKVRDIAVKVREWIAEHPTLSSWIAKITLGMGALMAAIGPVLMVLPGLVKGFQTLKSMELGSKLTGQFKGLGADITSVSGVLGKLPAIGMAAFVGWNIGRLIGEITGLDGVIEGLSTKIIDKFGLWNGSAEAVDLTTERLAKRQLFLGTASQIAGKEITNLNEAIDIIKAAYEKSGTVGNKTLDDWAKKSNDADAATRKLSGGVSTLAKLLEEFGIKTRTELVKQLDDAKSALDQLRKSGEATPGAVKALQDKIKDLTEQLHGVDKAGKEFSDWLDGLVPKMSDVSTWLKKVDDLYAKGKISPAQYAAALKDLTEKFDKLGEKINRVLPPVRGMSKVWDEMKPKIGGLPPVLEDVAHGFDDAQTALKYWSRELDTGIDKIIEANLAWLNFQFTLLGFGPVLAGINFNSMLPGAKAATEGIGHYFDGLMNDIASKFGTTIEKWVSGLSTFKDFWKGMWEDVKSAFFKIIGEMVASELIKGIKNTFSDIFKSVKKDAEDAGKGIVDSLGGGIASVGKGLAGLATSIGTVITILATAVGTGIVTIATAIASAVVALATGIVTAATILAASAPALLIVGGIALALFAGFEAIKSLFGGGGGGGDKEREYIHDARNFLADIKNWFFSAGSGFGGAIWDFLGKFEMEKFDGLKASIDLSRDSLNPKVDEANGWLRSIDGRGGDIATALGNLKSAAGGAISTTTELVAVHGTPANPEYVIPGDKLLALGPAAKSGRGGNATVNIYVNVPGTVITDSEYTRTRFMPQFIQALKSSVLKAEIQQALGVG